MAPGAYFSDATHPPNDDGWWGLPALPTCNIRLPGCGNISSLDPRAGGTADVLISNPILLPNVEGEVPPGNLFQVSIGEAGGILAFNDSSICLAGASAEGIASKPGSAF